MRARIQIGLSEQVSLDVFTAIVNDLSATLRFAQAAQAAVDRNKIIRRALRGGPGYYDLPFPGPWALYALRAEDLVDGELAYFGESHTIRVMSVGYGSPFSINFNFNGDVITNVIEIIRDWRTSKRINDAEARIAEARARNYEDQERHNRLLRAHVQEKLATGEASLSPVELNNLLTASVLRSMTALLDSEPEIVLEDDSEASD